MLKSLYFGYGSNLNAGDWSRWCSKEKYEETSFDALFKKVDNAWLADYRPGFTVYSSTRKGGVLDIVEAKGCVTPGVLFEVNEDAIAKLNHKEGCPGFYRRLKVVVQTSDEIKEAFTYQVVSPKGDFIQPSDEYARVVCNGLKMHGLGDEHIRNAATWKEQTTRTNIFVYGTLRTGELLAELLAEYPRKPASIHGRLYNLGWFPGLYLDCNAGPVSGEVVTVNREMIAQLDQIEGFHGYNEQSLYHRVWLPKEILGEDGDCWTYIYARPESELSEEKRIPSGDWHKREITVLNEENMTYQESTRAIDSNSNKTNRHRIQGNTMSQKGAKGQTITLFLMDEDVSGRIKCTIAGWTGVVYKIPRKDLDDCKDRTHLKQSGVYFLFGSIDPTGEKAFYAGQAGTRKNGEGILNRLQEHRRNSDKNYWTEAVAITTTDNSFGPTEISYLENRFRNLAVETNRYKVMNINEPTPGNISEEKECELEKFIFHVKIVLGTLGYKVFIPVDDTKPHPQKKEKKNTSKNVLLHLKRSKADATGRITSDGFAVLKNSKIVMKPVKSCPPQIKRLREEYADCIDDQGILLKDILFSSPSAAGGFVAYASVNGLVEWVTSEGKTLKDLEL